MAPLLNWDRIQALDPEKLDENEAEDWYQDLLSVKIDKETDVERLQAIFRLTREIMKLKASEAQVAIEEVEQIASDRAKVVADREQELTKEIEDLKLQLSALRRQSGETNVSKEAQPLKDEIRFLTEENQRLERDFAELRRDIAHEKEVAGRYASRVENYEKEVRDLRKERDQLIEDVRECQRQLESQRESLSNRRVEGEDMQKKMRNRNQDMIQLVDEVNNLTEANDALQKQKLELESSLEEYVRQMEKTTDQYARMKEALKETDSAVDMLQSENAELQKKLAELGVRGPKQPTLEDELLAAVDKKIDEWKVLFQEKDRELTNAKKQIEDLHHEITQYQMDSDRTSIVAMTKAIEQRDQTINALKNDLQQYTVEMERSSLVMDELRSQLNMGGNITATQKQRMQELQKNLKNKENIASESIKRAKEAEQHALDRDKQLADLLTRMRQYESKEFGLAEAVDEMREFKIQLDMRDKQNEELIQHCSKLEIHVNELLDENEELRERLGLDKHIPLSVTFKHAKRVQRETERALNVILQKEIERLEDERIEMKLQMRKLAQRLGERAVALGLSADDLMVIEQFAEDLKGRGKRRKSTDRRPSSPAQKPDPKSQMLMEEVTKENKSLRTKIAQLEAENVKMLQGIKEIRAQLQDGTTGLTGGGAIVTPTLDKLVSALEARELTGNLDAVMQMKSQLDTLTGRHDELRLEYRQNRVDLQKAQISFHDEEQKAIKLAEQVKNLTESAKTIHRYQAYSLPEGIQPTSAMVIMNLNEHLIQIMQVERSFVFEELSLKTEQLNKLEDTAEIYRRKISVLKHQQSLLYKQHLEAQKSWNEEKQRTDKKYANMEESHQTSQIQIAQFQRLLDTLNQDENEVKRRLGEMTRKFTVMTINEKIMIRKYNLTVDSENELRKDKELMTREVLDMENAITEKVGYLERQKEISTYQMVSLQKAVENSVPQNDYEMLSKQNAETTEKYRQLMEAQNKLLSEQNNHVQHEMERQKLIKENESYKRQLQTEKEKSNKLEILIEAGRLSGIASPANWNLISSDNDSGLGSISELHSVSQRFALLEMKELNERQKAEHVQQMWEQQKDQLRLLEQRNAELEEKFDKLTVINAEVQKIEQNLRDELAGCVPKSIHEAEKGKLAQVEKLSVDQRFELDRLKEVSEVAKSQYDYLQKNLALHNIELNQLREFVRDVQSENDQKAIIGQLHRQIVRLKLNETSAEYDLKSAKEKIAKLELSLRRSRQQTDENRRSLDHFRIEYVHRVQQLRKTINELRRRYTGAVPLDEQEKFHSLLTKVKNEREKLKVDLIQAVNKETEANGKLVELEVRQVGLEELISTIKDNKGAQKIVEWHKKMEQCQLSEMKAKRQLTRLEHQITMQNNVMATLESTVSSLEMENVQITKKWQEGEVAWEQRENELENKIRIFENEERYANEQLEEADPEIADLLDGSLTLVEQVDRTMVSLKRRIHSEKLIRRQLDHLNKDVDQLTVEKKRLEADLFRKDRLILDLRKLIPDNIARHFDSTIDHGLPVFIDDKFEKFDLQQAARILLETTEQTFKARLEQKEEALEKYRQLLQSVQIELTETRKSHQDEISKLLQELSQLESERTTKWREDANRMLLNLEDHSDTEKHLMRIAELEDVAFEQETRIANLAEKLFEANSERDRLKLELEILKKQTSAVVISTPVPPSSREGSRIGSTKRPESAATVRSRHSVRTLEQHEETVVIIEEGPEPAPDHEPKQPDQLEITEVTKEIVHEKIKSRRSSAGSESGKSVDSQIIDISESMRTTTRTVVHPQPAIGPQPNLQSESEGYLKMKVECQRLRTKLKEKDQENKKLTQVIGSLKADMLNAASQLKPTRPESDSGMKEMELKELKLKLEDVEEKFRKQRNDIRKSKNKEEDLISEIQELKGELDRKDSIISKLKSDKDKLDKEVTNLETRLSRLRDSVKLKLEETENKELRKRLAILENRLQTEQRTTAEKPDSATDKRNESVLRWEEKKTLQKRVDKLKETLSEKTKENEEQHKIINRLRERITRLEQQEALTETGSRFGGSSGKQVVPASNQITVVDSLTTEMWELERREMHLQIIQQRALLDKFSNLDESYSQLKSRNEFLEEKCSALERRLQQSAHPSTLQIVTEIDEVKTTVFGPNADLNGKDTKELESIIEMLRRLLEQAYKDRENLRNDAVLAKKEFQDEKEIADRLRNRVKELQNEVQILHEEVEEFREDIEQADKGYKYELVNRLHSKVEQLEIENSNLLRQIDELKLNSSRLTDHDLQKLVRENRELKEKLSRAAPRVAWSEQLTGESKNQTVIKLIGDNDKMRKDLRKSENECLKLNRDLEKLKLEKEKLEGDLRNAQMIIEQRRRWQPGTSVSGFGRVEHHYEIDPDTESALKRKTTRIHELETLLKLEIEKNQTMIYENKRITSKIKALEWTPSREQSTDDLLRQIRQLKVELVRLETEHVNLKDELETFSKRIEPVFNGKTDFDLIAFKERMKIYDRVLHENIDLKLENNGLKARLSFDSN